MPRYIDADVVAEIIAEKAKEPNYQHEGEDWKFGLCIAETAIEETPTADVVPKSEADEIAEELSDTIVMKDELFDEVIKLRGELANTKAEVAREIFAEIEKAICGTSAKNVIECTFEIDRTEYIELKKKHTEGKE